MSRRRIFYRVCSDAEHRDIIECGRLRPAKGSVEGKYFTDSVRNAKRFAALLYAKES